MDNRSNGSRRWRVTAVIKHQGRGGLAPWQARIVKTHVNTHLDGNLRIKELARIVRLSSFHFSRAFRVSFGHSPHAYVTRLRVEHAEGLILTTNLKLGQIALDCGFADQAHFTKQFRRSCGESPGEWRRWAYRESTKRIVARRPGRVNTGAASIVHETGEPLWFQSGPP
jgi:transcriptional regulator GlxA family with amidase domain